jgi:superfamily II DNA or RNA helicase
MNVDVFQNVNWDAEGREFLALLSTSGASVHIFASSEDQARQKAHDFIEAERLRQAKTAATREALAQRKRKTADE